MESIIKGIIEVSISFTFLFFLILLIRKLFQKQLSAFVQLALWTLLIIRLVLPVSFETPLSPWNVFNRPVQTPLYAKEELSANTKGPSYSNSPLTPAISASLGDTADNGKRSAVQEAASPPVQIPDSNLYWGNFVFSLLVFGALFRMVWFFIKVRCLHKNIRLYGQKVKEPIQSLLLECLGKTGLNKTVQTVFLPGFQSPAVFGILRPVLILPQALQCEHDQDRLKHILIHELTHIKRGDMWLILLLNCLAVLYWFHPLVWIACRLIRKDMETVCDTDALRFIGQSERNRYISTILYFASMEHTPSLTAGVSINDGKISMQRRIEGMYKKQKTSRSLVIILCILFGILAFAAFSTACGNLPKTQNLLENKTLFSDKNLAEEKPVTTITTDSKEVTADSNFLKEIVSILLIGVDCSNEGVKGNAKRPYNADTLILLTINTKTNEIHLVSLPRDTYVKIPGSDSAYRLKSVIELGGGWPTEGGFKKACEAASWILGGVPVPYYYTVDMSAFQALVDSIGGIDYNIDIEFSIEKRSYKKGMQHLDGQGVLDYIRERKYTGGDLNRTNRQRAILAAIFKKLKDSGMLTKMPDIINSFKGSLYTNTAFAQTAALTVFFKNVDVSAIKMDVLDGAFGNAFGSSFMFTDQKKRVKLIKEIYGIDVQEYSDYTNS